MIATSQVGRRPAWLPMLLFGPGLFACGQPDSVSVTDAPPDVAAYLGGSSCVDCHAEQFAAWRGSHHDLSMQIASDQTVLGDFSATQFDYFGQISTFFRRDGEYLVNTKSSDGSDAEYRISHTFGVEPLQQYLIEFPDGRYQALSLAWDSRPPEAGGQRWFHLNPDEPIDVSDPLHWSGDLYNWNTRCAACHSTNLVKNYALDTDSFATAWSSIDVDCEACHGPGSLHVADQNNALALPALANPRWRFDAGQATAVRVTEPSVETIQLDSCAPCHSRRTEFADDRSVGESLLQRHRPSLLTEDLYHPDGQIDDEVYVYGSFLQSKMHAAGVVCSDCHDPHSLRLLRQGNDLCGGCHVASTFDSNQHHHHARASQGSLCVNCHMTAKTYMVVDPRRDHSLRVPRPDLSAALATSSACDNCHLDQSQDWAATIVRQWFPEGRASQDHYGEALHAGRVWGEDRDRLLRLLAGDSSAPDIARATALSMLAEQFDDAALDVVEAALQVESKLIQLAALGALEAAAFDFRISLAQSFLTNPTRVLRMESARVLIPLRDQLSARRRADFDVALNEYIAAQRYNSDSPEGLYNLGNVYDQLGRRGDAQIQYEQAIAKAPWFAPAYINLADLYRRLGLELEVEALLRDAATRLPDDASIHHALGLALVRADRVDEAVESIETAAILGADEPVYGYVFGVTLNSIGRQQDSLEFLESTRQRFPGFRPLLFALATINRDAGKFDAAIRYTEQLLRQAPADITARSLLDELQGSATP